MIQPRKSALLYLSIGKAGRLLPTVFLSFLSKNSRYLYSFLFQKNTFRNDAEFQILTLI